MSAAVNIACPIPKCGHRFEFTCDGELWGFVDPHDVGCMTVTITGDQGAIREHLTTHTQDEIVAARKARP